MELDFEIDKLTHSLDDIGFIGIQSRRRSQREEKIFDAAFSAAKTKRKALGRSLTDEENQQIFSEAERTYNREMRQKRKVQPMTTLVFSNL